ncbi:MAG TPA: hypothetical protein VIY73_04305 [Polyangiaceae bacterium]
MRIPAILLFSVVLSLGGSERLARADDAASALAELKLGYALKKDGNCRDAVPHFLASQRLAPSDKALLNLADCELRLGDVAAARTHAVAGLDLARQHKDDELAAIAQAQIVAIDAAQADAAKHAMPLEPAPVPPPPAPPQTQPVAEPVVAPPPTPLQPPPQPEKRGTPTGRVVAYVLGGAGVVGIGIGTGFGIDAISKNGASNASGHCTGGCDSTGKSLREQALSSATASTVAFGVGLAALAAGVVLYVVTPGGVEVQPSVGASYGGVTVGKRW